MEFFLGTRTLDSLCVGLVGMKAALDDAPSLWSNPIVKVGSKEQDLKKRLDFHFLLCSMIESLVNVNTIPDIFDRNREILVLVVS